MATGRHQIAIVNRELGIDDRFTVDVRTGSAQTILKDYDKPPPPEPKPEPPPPEPKPEPKRDKTINPFAKPAGK